MSERPDTAKIRAALDANDLRGLQPDIRKLCDALDAARAESTRDLLLAVEWQSRALAAEARITFVEDVRRELAEETP